jgi:hypothetical protein
VTKGSFSSRTGTLLLLGVGLAVFGGGGLIRVGGIDDADRPVSEV